MHNEIEYNVLNYGFITEYISSLENGFILKLEYKEDIIKGTKLSITFISPSDIEF